MSQRDLGRFEYSVDHAAAAAANNHQFPDLGYRIKAERNTTRPIN
jgi:hypothetical protein